MKRILLLATGGTIASLRTEKGLDPELSSEELLSFVPEIRSLCSVDTRQVYELDSTNMRPEHWLNLSRIIKEEYDRYDGFVITHGTDTMAYAAALLYYLIQNSPKPVVLTGAQIPISARDTDARENLTDAFRYAACDRACGVHIVFGGKIIAGNRARKNRTKSYSAFKSVDYPEIGIVQGDRIRLYIREELKGPVLFSDEIDPSVLVIKLIPGMSAGIFDYVAENCHAVIIESFGVGGLPYYNSDEFADKIELLTKKNVRVVITTQVPHEGSDMSVYRVGLRIKEKYEFPEAYDMTTEAVSAKIMWVLPKAKTSAEFRELFLSPIGEELL